MLFSSFILSLAFSNIWSKWFISSSDYDAMVLSSVEEKMPTYIFYRLDSINDLGYEWIYIVYSPDFAPVRFHQF